MTDRIDTKETTMTTYTEQDFKAATFARHPDGRTAMRFEADSRPWLANTDRWRSDVEMAEDGWVPVREAAAQPITLNALRRAWEGAERTSEYKAGDEVIVRYKADDFSVIRFSADRVVTNSRFRILHRAPKPKNPGSAERLEALVVEWSDLARSGVPMPALVDWLAERGMHVTEEGEK